jgi:predicted DCC family thiol-disulfide oxidoreductase YuxK
MHRLYVLYDARCGLCRLARLWASEQPAYLELVFLPAGSDEAKMRFPGLSATDPPEELVVVSDEGHIYRDSSAWIMCLYALEDYREWSLRLASPALRPFARQAFAFVSRHRSSISTWLRLSDADAVQALRRVEAPSCAWTVEPKITNAVTA